MSVEWGVSLEIGWAQPGGLEYDFGFYPLRNRELLKFLCLLLKEDHQPDAGKEGDGLQSHCGDPDMR